MIRVSLYCLVISFFLFNSCTKEDPIIPNEEEVITTLNYILTNDIGEQIVMQFKDLNGGINPIIIGGVLKKNTTYVGSLELLNELGANVIDITKEIIEEGVDHQLFYETSIPEMTIEYTDSDENMNPIGVGTRLITKGAGSGTLKIILRHEPDKNAAGVANGSIINAGGETDIEVIFDVNVE